MSAAAGGVPPVDAEVVDVPTGMRAVVQDVSGSTVRLRRPGGGVEWTRHLQDIRLVDEPAEVTP